jgi:23S rRNA pseudouridine1911/1915/1917 synthase
MASELRILYEDNHIVGVLKPGGLLTQGDRTGDDTALAMTKRYIKRKYDKPGNVYLGLVHRIDRPVSGVLLLARTSKAASRLSREFHDRRVEKTYLAVVIGYIAGDRGELVDYITRSHNRSRAAKPTDSTSDRPLSTPAKRSAKEAALTYTVLARSDGMTLLEVIPSTGRHHQIRVQLSAAEHSVVGDLKYGAGEPLPDKTIALHAARLRVRHPIKDEVITLEAAPPDGYPWQGFRSTIESYFGRGGREHRREHRPD